MDPLNLGPFDVTSSGRLRKFFIGLQTSLRLSSNPFVVSLSVN